MFECCIHLSLRDNNRWDTTRQADIGGRHGRRIGGKEGGEGEVVRATSGTRDGTVCTHGGKQLEGGIDGGGVNPDRIGDIGGVLPFETKSEFTACDTAAEGQRLVVVN